MKILAITVAALAIAATVALPAQAALVGLYKFDSGANLGLDSSGLGNHLQNYGGTSTTGLTGGGLALDGSSKLSTATGLVPFMFPLGSSAYTLSADFKTTSNGAARGIVGWGAYDYDNNVNALRLFEAGGFRHYWWSNDLDVIVNASDGQWHNVLVSFDGTTRKLYFNGVLSGSDTPGLPDVQDGNFAIGLTYFGEYFDGTLDNVAIYNTAQSPGAVPEPASWALMVAGFGLVGCVIRRRSAALAA